MMVVSVLETLSYNAHEDCMVVMPTLGHATHWWPILIDAYKLHHGEGWIKQTKTAIVSHRTDRILRLWVPYELDPTMPMDWPRLRRGFRPLNLYGMFGGRVL